MGTTFNGTSSFSSSFQQVIQRAVAIANLPIKQLQQQQANLQTQVTALNSLETKVTSIGSSLDAIANAAGSGALAVSSSQPTIATPIVSGTPQAGSYTIQVTDIGASSTSLSGASLPTISDPTTQGITSSTSLTLTIDGTPTSIQPTDSSLNALVSAINSANAGAQASIVNLGPPSAPDYRLYLRSTSLGPVNIGLSDGTNSLADSLSTGSPVLYNVNGLPAGGISSDSRTITLSPGLTVNLQANGTTDITVSRSATSLQNALSSFVTAYNSSIDELSLHRGKAGGALSGDSVISTVSNTLRSLLNYKSSTPGVTSLSDLGITFDASGKLTFDATAVSNVDEVGLQNVSTFLGSSTTGGFLKAASDTLKGLDDSTSGIIQSTADSITNSIKTEQDLIDAGNARLDLLQTSLQDQMSKADALIASLQQQVAFFNSLYEATRSLNNSGF